MPDTFDIPGVEIFATGKHHGIDFTAADVDRMVSDTNAQAGREPYLGVGHDRAPDAGRVGTLTNLRAAGGKILADFMAVPQKILDAIRAGALPKRSVELRRDFEDKDGNIFPWIIDAVALLGAAHPEVKNLADIETLHATEGGGRLVIFTEANWPEEPKEFDVNDNITATVEETPVVEPTVEAEATEEDTTEMDALKIENEDLKGQVAALKSENGDMVDRVDKLETDANEAKVEAVMGELGRDGKVIQAEADMLRADLFDKLANPRMLSFSDETVDAYAATVAQLRARDAKVDFSEKSIDTGTPKADKMTDERLVRMGMTREQYDKAKERF